MVEANDISPTETTNAKTGMTLVELLVVVAIIGILVALLLPAVQSVRESARKSSCTNNIKQLGLALHDYHQARRSFPAAALYNPQQGDPSISKEHYANWLVMLLPHIEQQTLFDRIDLAKPISDDANRAARSVSVETFRCPSEPNAFAETPFSSEGEGDQWARGNYAANASLGAYSTEVRPAAGPRSPRWRSSWHRGVMGANTAVAIRQITDGTSKTIITAEIRSGIVSADRRGVWALSGPGSSSLWMHGSDDANGPNDCTASADNLMGCAKVRQQVNESNLKKECMGCWEDGTNQAVPRSHHENGVLAGFADGSVHFISNDIEKSVAFDINPQTTTGADFGVWQRLNASADSEPVDISSL